MKVAVAMLGARMHYAVPRLLHEAGLLERFYTDSYIGNRVWLERTLKALPEALRPKAVKHWLGRVDAVLPPQKVSSFEGLGFWYAIARRRAKSSGDLERIFAEAAVRFANHISPRSLQRADMLWGFNSASLELFRVAKERGMRCILEQTILPKRLARRMLREEAARWPDWALRRDAVSDEVTFSLGEEREEQEWALADRIVAGSEFVRMGLVELGAPREKIRVVPYGVDTRHFAPAVIRPSASEGGPLRVLFAGEVGLRKGIPDLLHAFDLLPPGAIELRLAGGISIANDKWARWRNRVAFLGVVPRTEMRALYQWADVFVLPSIVEGSATAIYEALISGVPVITTPNAGSIVRNGVDGFIVPVSDLESLSRTIGRYHEDRALLARHRHATTGNRDFAGLDRYRADLVRLIGDLVADGAPTVAVRA